MDLKKFFASIFGGGKPTAAATPRKIFDDATIARFKREIADQIKATGEESLEVAELLALHGTQLSYAGPEENKTAVDYMRRALKIREARFGQNSVEYAESLKNLAYALGGGPDLQVPEAEKLFHDSMSVFRGLGMEESPQYAEAIQLLSDLRLNQNNFPEALRLQNEAIDILARCRGEESGEYWEAQAALCDLYNSMDKYVEGERLAREAIARVGQIEGVPSEAVSTLYESLAFSLLLQGKTEESEAMDQRADELFVRDQNSASAKTKVDL